MAPWCDTGARSEGNSGMAERKPMSIHHRQGLTAVNTPNVNHLDYLQARRGAMLEKRNVDDVREKVLKVVTEIITTEQTYIKRLRLLHKDFRAELESQNRVKRMISQSTMKTIFSNIESIYKLHLQLLGQLLQQPLDVTKCRVGAVFCMFAHYLKMYAVYLNNVEPSRRLLAQLRRGSREFDELLTRLEFDIIYICMSELHKDLLCFVSHWTDLTQRPEFERMQVDMFLREPVARIPRYELLLQQYLKYLPSNSFDRRDAERAVELVKKAAVHANKHLREMDGKRRLVEWTAKLRSSDPSFSMIRPGCLLLRQDDVKVAHLTGNGTFHNRTVLLLTDQLVMCDSSYNVTEQLSLVGMKVVDESNHTAVTVKAQEMAVKLIFSSDDQTEEWIKEVQKTIDEFATARHSLLRSFIDLAKSIAYSRDELGVMAPVWVADADAELCMICGLRFGWISPRRHHCRACGVVVCGSCSKPRLPLAYTSYRRTRVCDNCTVILKHRTQRGLAGRHDNASLPAETGRVCTTSIDDELLSRNNQPVGATVRANSLKATVSGYLSVGRDESLADCPRRWFELHRDGVLYSFSQVTNGVGATTATVLHGYKLITRDDCASVDAEVDWQFALVLGQRALYVRTDTSQQLDRWIKELTLLQTSETCPLLQSSSLLNVAINAVRMFLS